MSTGFGTRLLGRRWGGIVDAGSLVLNGMSDGRGGQLFGSLASFISSGSAVVSDVSLKRRELHALLYIAAQNVGILGEDLGGFIELVIDYRQYET